MLPGLGTSGDSEQVGCKVRWLSIGAGADDVDVAAGDDDDE